MPRPEWVPDEARRRKLDKLARLAQRRDAIEAEYRALIAELADPEGDAIPIAQIAARANITRKTVYRYLGRPMS
ncbi:helix-turn-helix domain-containing protein [Micromonospora echinospora]|uniref:helix-turn-helix domain-containing protein n=1 Tax=Micromonospora echinospora TaxID=1877 RepID=UPI00379CBE5D